MSKESSGRHLLSGDDALVDRDRFDAVIFDLDGVLTRTATIHERAWKQLFDTFLERRQGSNAHPFTHSDYLNYLDGMPRYAGVRHFLAARGIELPRGSPDAAPGHDSVAALGNAKNEMFLQLLESEGLAPFDDAVLALHDLRERGFKRAVISASRNCRRVLTAVGLQNAFDTIVDGVLAQQRGLAGKPAPDIFLEAASRLTVAPQRSVVVEDALAGVKAGRAGRFGLVVGVDHTGENRQSLQAMGADVVVENLLELGPHTADPPSALEHLDAIDAAIGAKTPACFLDYDGTLTPIVAQPEDAILDDNVRTRLQQLAAQCPVAVISGRDLTDVRNLVGVDAIVNGGSHGFDIAGPGGVHLQYAGAQSALPQLDAAESYLEAAVASIPGARLERKRFSLAVHYRNVDAAHLDALEQAVAKATKRNPELRRRGGKKVWELQPNVEWHKGHAVDWLISTLNLDVDAHVPIYIGDDLTDEDGFRAVRQHGIGIVVGPLNRPTAARYRLDDPAGVHAFLRRLTARWE